jgi:hypothetical protein
MKISGALELSPELFGLTRFFAAASFSALAFSSVSAMIAEIYEQSVVGCVRE